MGDSSTLASSRRAQASKRARPSSPKDELLAWFQTNLTAKLILAAALTSGCATLVYELAWIRVLTLSVGATYPAITVVLASMMLGLGLGSVAGGRLADRSPNPLRIYVFVELGVLVLAALFPFVSEAVAHADLGRLGVLSGRSLLAGALMLPATIGVGMTFPLLSTALHRDDVGATHVPALYSANTLGAMGGTVLGGLVLPFAIGTPATLGTAALLNVLAGGIAWMGSRRALPRLEQPPAPADAEPTGFEDKQGLLLVLAFGSGALVMLAELFWTRNLIQIDREVFDGLAVESADMMALVMVLVLLGNGVGGLIAARFARWSPTQLARALSITWTIGGLAGLLILEWFGVRIGSASGEGSWRWYHLALRLLPVVLPSVLIGLSFPLLARLYAGALAGHGRRMGQVWMANTVGSVVASIFGGWVLIPSIGAGMGLILTAFLACALGLVASLLGDRRGRIGVAAAMGGVVLAALVIPLEPGQYYRSLSGWKVLDSWEGWESTTVVAQKPDGNQIIASNGRWIPGNPGYAIGGNATLDLIGRFRERDIKDAMLVGFGTGLFAQGMLQNEYLEHLVIVELDGGQLHATGHFGTGSVLTDPRVTIVVNDALHYLATTDRTFDAILVDAWGPEASPAIYSKQFHERALARLNPGGVVWAKLLSMITLDTESNQAVYDAVSCTYPIAALNIGQDKLPNAVLGITEMPTGLNRLQAIGPCTDDARPIDLLYPRRLRLDPNSLHQRRH